MKQLLALLACLVLIIAYALIAGLLGWKHGGGAIPILILLAALAATWKAIVKSGKTKH